LIRRLAIVDLAAWLLTAAEVLFDAWLGAFAVVGAGSAAAWLAGRRAARMAVIAVAVAYLLYYAERLYALQIEPLLVILPLHQATADALYLLWSSPMGRLSHGEVLDAARELWRGCLMPVIQLGMVFAAARAR
jgi:heme/copper-type cytochrome/quinol oxidase subunit 3